jgi:hypothetical protein
MNDQNARVRSVAVHGVGGNVVEIEANIGGGWVTRLQFGG